MGWLSTSQARVMTEDQRLDYLTRTVLGEAVGEGPTGMLVVAQVIANRSSDGRWPADPVAVAGQAWQFTTNAPGGKGNQKMVDNYPPSSREYQQAQRIVKAAVIDRSLPDIVGGATHYHTIQMGWPATWPKTIQRYGHLDIGNHRVYPEHPVPPGEIPYVVATFLDVVPPKPTRVAPTPATPQLGRLARAVPPASMPKGVNLQRELNRVAAERRRDIQQSIRKSRVLAFNNADPFEIGPSATRLNLGKKAETAPQRATGTIGSTARTFALMKTPTGMDAPGMTLVRTTVKPPVRQATPWTAAQLDDAAKRAAADASIGLGQMVMTGNPNRAGAVVDWLYPVVVEGRGEANQAGKGPRPTKDVVQTSVDRGKAAASPDLQAAAEAAARKARGEPEPRRAIPQSQIERNPKDIFELSIDRAKRAQPTLLGNLLTGHARPVPQSQIERAPSGVGKPPKTRVVEAVRVRVPGQSQIERSKPNVIDESFRRVENVKAPGAMLAADQAARAARTAMERTTPGQSTIERSKPIVVTSRGAARVVPQSQIERAPQAGVIRNAASPLTSQISTRRLTEAMAPAAPSRGVPVSTSKLNINRPNAVVEQRRIDPIGALPPFKDLATIGGEPFLPAKPAAPKKPAPPPASLRDRDLARGNQPPADVRPKATLVAPVPLAANARPVPRVAPVPADLSLRPRVGTLVDASGRPVLAATRRAAPEQPRLTSAQDYDRKNATAEARARAGGKYTGNDASVTGTGSGPGGSLRPGDRSYNPDTNMWE